MKSRTVSGCLLALLLLVTSCVQTRVKTYDALIEPRLGKSKKSEMRAVLGNPIFCKQEEKYEKCEYRSAYSQNNPVPDMFRKSEAIAPDLSPYEYFDVLHLYYDGFHILQEWEPVVIHP